MSDAEAALMYDSREDLVIRLIAIRASIAAARDRQRYGIDDFSVARAELRDLLDEERMVLELIAQADSGLGVAKTKVRFTRV